MNSLFALFVSWFSNRNHFFKKVAGAGAIGFVIATMTILQLSIERKVSLRELLIVVIALPLSFGLAGLLLAGRDKFKG